MTSGMGSTKLHELFQERWKRDFRTVDVDHDRYANAHRWLEYLERMGLRRTKVAFVPDPTPEGYPAYTMQFPDHEDSFFVLDPMDCLHLISVPKELALRALALEHLP